LWEQDELFSGFDSFQSAAEKSEEISKAQRRISAQLGSGSIKMGNQRFSLQLAVGSLQMLPRLICSISHQVIHWIYWQVFFEKIER